MGPGNEAGHCTTSKVISYLHYVAQFFPNQKCNDFCIRLRIPHMVDVCIMANRRERMAHCTGCAHYLVLSPERSENQGDPSGSPN